MQVRYLVLLLPLFYFLSLLPHHFPPLSCFLINPLCRFRMKRIPDQPAVEKREDYTPGAKRVKRPTAPPKPRITACLRGDMGYLCVSIDALIQRATQDGVCVVCDCVVPVGDVAGFAAHVEGHVEELWNSLENVEKEVSFYLCRSFLSLSFFHLFFDANKKLAIRGVINAERIEYESFCLFH